VHEPGVNGAEVPPELTGRLDGFVDRARHAARAFRELGQDEVDRIVWAMVTAGLKNAVELAELAMEETGFGVFEDKVVKNYIATEFLYDYLKDKRSVGVIDEDPERGIEYVVEPIGVVLALTPITNPTSTVLFKAIVAAKTRNAIIFRPSARAARCGTRAAELMQAAGEAAGLPADAIQVIPDPTLDVSQYLFHHDGVDFIWTTGGPKAVAAANRAGKPCLSVGPGNAPVYIHRSADIAMAVVDMLISKTFDSSVICPAEQTCVIDEPVWDEMVAELQRMGARLLPPADVERLADFAFGDDGQVEPASLGQSCANLGRLAGFDAAEGDKVLLAELPSDLDGLRRHALVHEKLMPVLGLVRSPSLDHALAVCRAVTELGGLGHTSAVYANDDEVVGHFADAVSTGRILVNAPTAVGALGGVYNSLTPTFSLGCGTWGGSSTTDNVNYRNLLNVKTVARRQAPPQWFRVPSDTYFNPGAIDSLRELKAHQAVVVTDPEAEARGVADEVRRRLDGTAVHVFSELEPEPGEQRIRAGVRVLEELRPDLLVAIGGGSVIDAAKAMRLFHESPDLTLDELTLPFLDARKRVAHYPEIDHELKLVAVPTTAGTGSEVSPAAVLSVAGRKETLVDYSLVPDMAVVDPRLTLSMPSVLTADTGIDALTHALEAAVSIFASPYTVHGRLLRPGREPDPRAPAEGVRARLRPRGANGDVECGDDRRPCLLQRLRRREPRACARRRGPLLDRTRARQRDLPAARAALQRLAPIQVHAGARLHGLCGAREVRADRLDHRPRWQERGAAPRAAIRASRSAARRGRRAALAGGGRSGSRRLRRRASGAGSRGVRGREHSHEPADAARRRAGRAARGRLPRPLGRRRAAWHRGFPAPDRVEAPDAWPPQAA
jgi:acetaldehyde dehydrogenase/alcohol dehydrogenase